MSLKNTISMLTLLGLATAVAASEQVHTRIAVAVVDDAGEEVKLDLDSADLGFNLHDMQVGENYAFVDDAGRNVLITRTATGFDFNVDGKSIAMPAPGADDAELVWIAEGEEGDVDVHVLHETEIEAAGHDGQHEIRVIRKVVKAEE